MRRWYLQDVVVYLIVTGIVVFFVFIISLAVAIARTERICLNAGYSDERVDWTFTGYCIKRENNSDIVVPVTEIRKK